MNAHLAIWVTLTLPPPSPVRSRLPARHRCAPPAAARARRRGAGPRGHLLGLGEELRIVQGTRERRAQRRHAVGWHAGRRKERAAHVLRRQQEFEYLAILRRLGRLDDERDA